MQIDNRPQIETSGRHAPDPIPPLLTQDEQNAIDRARAASTARHTSRVYRSQIGMFEAWCKARGHSAALPVHPRTVAAYLTSRQEAGAARSTLCVIVAAIKAGHRVANFKFDDSDPVLLQVREGLNRLVMAPERQAKPLTPKILRNILDSFEDAKTRPLQSTRDAAMLALLYMGALRRSEIVAIDFQTLGSGMAVLRLDDEKAEIELLTSKASQAASAFVTILRDYNPRGFAALEKWIADAGIEPGTPFCRGLTPGGNLTPHRLTHDGFNIAIKAAIVRYYRSHNTDLETAKKLAAGFSGHSGRVGLVVAAKEAGVSDSAIAATTRHKTLSMIQRYGRQADRKIMAGHLAKVGLK